MSRGPFYLEIMERVVAGERPTWGPRASEGSPTGWRELVENCWCQDPEARPTMIEALVGLEEMQAVFQREVAAEAYDELQRSTSSPLPTSPRGKRQTHS